MVFDVGKVLIHVKVQFFKNFAFDFLFGFFSIIFHIITSIINALMFYTSKNKNFSDLIYFESLVSRSNSFFKFE